MKKISKFIYLAVVLAIWWVGSIVVNKSLFVPSPVETFGMIANLFEDGIIFKHLGASFLRITAGVLIAAAISIPLGMGIAWYKPVNRIFKPIVDSFQYIPVTCFQAILFLLLGIDEEMKITFITIAVLFSFLPTVIQTCKEDFTEITETAYTMGFSYTRTLIHCVIPYVAPSILKSLITVYGVGWTYVILAEINNTPFGLGHLMHISQARGQSAMVWGAILIIAVVSFIFNKVANFIIKKCFKWRYLDEQSVKN